MVQDKSQLSRAQRKALEEKNESRLAKEVTETPIRERRRAEAEERKKLGIRLEDPASDYDAGQVVVPIETPPVATPGPVGVYQQLMTRRARLVEEIQDLDKAIDIVMSDPNMGRIFAAVSKINS